MRTVAFLPDRSVNRTRTGWWKQPSSILMFKRRLSLMSSFFGSQRMVPGWRSCCWVMYREWFIFSGEGSTIAVIPGMVLIVCWRLCKMRQLGTPPSALQGYRNSHLPYIILEYLKVCQVSHHVTCRSELFFLEFSCRFLLLWINFYSSITFLRFFFK